MNRTLDVPPVTASPESHADWLELRALQAGDDGVSIREYVGELRMGGTADAMDDEGDSDMVELDDDDICESRAEAAFVEIDDRFQACGGSNGAYPFAIVDESVLAPRPGTDDGSYAFMSLLSKFGHKAGPKGSDGAKLFEELSAKAIEGYLGHSKVPGAGEYGCGVRSTVFGFPRRVLPKSFASAVDELCKQFGEGMKHRSREKLPDQQDGKLDVVGWKEFGDSRQGKLIVFGQCATGGGWASKLTELPPTVDWCSNWMEDRPAVWPIRAFFVPHRVERENWWHACVHGGLLFDRCRIAQQASGTDGNLSERLAAWSNHVMLTQLREK